MPVSGTVQQLSISRGGIPKLPVLAAEVTPLGIAGDGHRHPEFHGGPDQALLLLTADSLAELAAAGYAVYPGALGENVTVEGLSRRQIRPGQRYRLGQTEIEITVPREPCRTLTPLGSGIQRAVYDDDVKAGRPSSPRWGLAGFYARVLTPGPVCPGDPIVLLDERA